MTAAADWLKVEAALDELLDLDADTRPAALARLAARDPALHLQVESLLAQVATSDRLLDQPALLSIAQAPPAGALAAGVRIGAYRIAGLVGRGGMGEVYAAQRADGNYEQKVALKLIRRDAADHLGRFEAERQILANLNHPRIARLLDGGLTDDGQPYMIMEYVEGEPIIAWCRSHAATLATRLDLFQQVCEAVGFAHRHLVVHRDLKPSNVFITHDGAVKLLDFGAAKLLDRPPDEHTHNAPMTPGYAAPEQLQGGPITTATDVYALGLLLFELLCEEPPWRFERVSIAAALDLVLNREAPRLSDFAARLPQRPVPPRALRGDLDAIVAKALRKEPGRRYATVDGLQEDVAACREGRPVGARGGNLGYLLGRALRRNAVLTASVAAVLVALIAGAAGIAWQAQKAREEARRETALKEFLLSIFRNNSVDNPNGADARNTTAQQLLDRGAKSVTERLDETPEVRAELIDAFADLYDQLEEFDRVEALERTRLADLDRRDGGKPSPGRALALAELGRALAMTNRYPEAEQTLAAALRTMDAIGDDHSAARVQALTTLGLVDYHVRPVADPNAATHTAAALALLEKYNPTSPDRLSAVQLLARIAQRAHEDATAERDYRAFLALADSPTFADQPVALGSALDDLARFLSDQGRYAEAEPLVVRAIAVLERAEGPDQLDASVARANLGVLYAATNRPVEAERAFQAALAGCERSQGADHGQPVGMRRLLGELGLDRGRLPEARALLVRNFAVLAHNGNSDVNNLARNHAAYARLLVAEGDYAGAAAAQREAERLLATFADPHSEERARNQLTAADLEVLHDRPEQAAAMYGRVAAEWRSSPTLLPAPYVLAMLGIAEARLRAGAYGAATTGALQLLNEILARPHPEYYGDWEARVRHALGMALLRSGQAAAAVTHLRRAVELRQHADAEASPYLALARIELGQALAASGHEAEAHALWQAGAVALRQQTTLGLPYRTAQRLAESRLHGRH